MEAKRVGYMISGARDQKRRRICIVCKKPFLGGGGAKYCLDHKPIR